MSSNKPSLPFPSLGRTRFILASKSAGLWVSTKTFPESLVEALPVGFQVASSSAAFTKGMMICLTALSNWVSGH